MKLAKLTIGLAVVALAASACSSSSSPAPAASGGAASSDRAGISIEVVTHGQASDPVLVDLQERRRPGRQGHGRQGDVQRPRHLRHGEDRPAIDAACAKNPSGLVISLPDATALGPSVTKCVDRGFPVISANSSDTPWPRPITYCLGPGGIYTTIRRLSDDGLIEESDERPDPDLDDQRRRYYRLTGTGRAVAGAEVRRLDLLVRAARPWALDAG